MSIPRQRQFEVLTNAKSPFLTQEKSQVNDRSKGRKKRSKKGTGKTSKEGSEGDRTVKVSQVKGSSGSKWNVKHLDWLHILLESGCDLKDIFSQGSALSQSSKIAKSLRGDVGKDWKWICAYDHEKANSFYARLQSLVSPREEDDGYNTHSNTQSTTKHLTSHSIKSNSVKPHQQPLGTLDFVPECQRTPTPLPHAKGGFDPQLHMSQLLGRKRQVGEVISPQRERQGRKNPHRQAENTPSPSCQQRGGSPNPREHDTEITRYQLQNSATPCSQMAPLRSPVISRQLISKTPSSELLGQTTHDRQEFYLKSISSRTWQQDPKKPIHNGKLPATIDERKDSPKILLGTSGISPIVASQQKRSHSVAPDNEEIDSYEEDEEEEEKEEEGEGDDTDEEKSDGEYGEEDGDEEDHGEEEEEEEEEEDGDAGGASEVVLHDKSEKDVEFAGLAFLCLVEDAINDTKKGLDVSIVQKQNVRSRTRDPRSHEIKIDDISMSTHPDLVLEIAFGEERQRKSIGVVLEFKKKDHGLNDEQLLGQEVSELLGAVLEKMAANGHQKVYKSYLISWHGLKDYISRFHATRKYLQLLQANSRALQDLDSPTVRRSEEFDLTVTQKRIDFAIACARIAVEELQAYDRNRTSGLLDRILS